VITDFKLRYQGSVLGYAWSLLRPLALFIILYLVFSQVFRVGDDVPHYPVYLLLGIVLWNYFTEVTSGSVTSIVTKGDLIRKINFPKYVIVLAGSFSAIINLFLNSLIIIVFLFINHVGVTAKVIFLPFILLELFVLSLGVAFFLSSVYVKFRDINYIWEVLMQGAFYATPILYPLSYVIKHASLGIAQIMMLNPMAQIIQDTRYVLVTPSTQTIGDAYSNGLFRLAPIMFVILFTLFSALYFKKNSKYFAERV
jgi:ABC-2 type transport system permease protein